MNLVKGGINICGVSIGVLSLESYFPKPPGHIKNPSSLPFTLTYEIIQGLTVSKLLNSPTPDMLDPLLDAARRLERSGVKAITGSCGFLALFQAEIAQAVSVPVFVSSLVQLPLIHTMTQRPVGVLTASAPALTEKHLAGAGAAGVPVLVQGMEDSAEFADVILRGVRDDMDLDKVESELLAAGRQLVARDPEIGAVLLECTDLPPYAHALQRELQRPVFDIITLASMVHSAVLRGSYAGFIR
ncbi:aspartate/glutamate racemase family protein [Ruegeria sp. PrR005]|uniref:Aspartate/glutamate racemase family protein n=1 Tax=Ruegeria sp. PrR005 TaxID=2706882 RepID=A0A6B2NVT8_9RHOB|nr:aspartate/glutamate racemase family protein [Ruegeria sp. PrR005]NDW46534.1 aspartate/glutamate racemase family protein [Ruegeria sp. PrR005]